MNAPQYFRFYDSLDIDADSIPGNPAPEGERLGF
jgi:hypothetical protein